MTQSAGPSGPDNRSGNRPTSARPTFVRSWTTEKDFSYAADPSGLTVRITRSNDRITRFSLIVGRLLPTGVLVPHVPLKSEDVGPFERLYPLLSQAGEYVDELLLIQKHRTEEKIARDAEAETARLKQLATPPRQQTPNGRPVRKTGKTEKKRLKEQAKRESVSTASKLLAFHLHLDVGCHFSHGLSHPDAFSTHHHPCHTKGHPHDQSRKRRRRSR